MRGFGGAEELGVQVWRGAHGEGDDEEVDVVQGCDDGVLRVVVDGDGGCAGGDVAFAGGVAEGGDGVVACCQEGGGEVRADAAGDL